MLLLCVAIVVLDFIVVCGPPCATQNENTLSSDTVIGNATLGPLGSVYGYVLARLVLCEHAHRPRHPPLTHSSQGAC